MMKRSQPRRSWVHARYKCDAEGCRICGLPAEAAHIVGRVHDKRPPVREPNWKPWAVHPDRIVPLCGPTPGGHHGQYDRGELDLLPHLTLAEQVQAVADAGSIDLARKRICGGAYLPAAEEAA